MTKLKTKLYELGDLESIQLETISENGQRFYVGENDAKYPSVTTVVGLRAKEQIKLWRQRVGEETANKITKQATNRGTKFHQHIEDYLRQEKEYIEFDLCSRTVVVTPGRIVIPELDNISRKVKG